MLGRLLAAWAVALVAACGALYLHVQLRPVEAEIVESVWVGGKRVGRAVRPPGAPARDLDTRAPRTGGIGLPPAGARARAFP